MKSSEKDTNTAAVNIPNVGVNIKLLMAEDAQIQRVRRHFSVLMCIFLVGLKSILTNLSMLYKQWKPN